MINRTVCAAAIVIALVVVWMSDVAIARTLTLAVPAVPDGATQVFINRLIQAPELRRVGLSVEVRHLSSSEQQDLVSMIRRGRVHLGLLPIELIDRGPSNQDLSHTSLMALPSIIDNPKELFALQDSVFGAVVVAEIGRQGLLALAHWNREPISLLAKQRISSAFQLAGLKIGSPSEKTDGFYRALKASPVRVFGGPVQESAYQALAKGEIGAFEWSPMSIVGVAPTRSPLTLTRGGSLFSNFRQQIGFLVANQDFLVNLTEVERVQLATAATAASTAGRQEILKGEGALSSIAKEFDLRFANFSTLNPVAAEMVFEKAWLQQAGERGRRAYELLTRLRREGAPKRELKKGEAGGRRFSQRPQLFFVTLRNDEHAPNFEHRFGARLVPGVPLSCGEVQFGAAPPLRTEPFAGAIDLKQGSLKTGEHLCAEDIAEAADRAGGRLIIFVHGFANSFGSAIRRYIGISGGLSVGVPGIVWSWPSIGDYSLKHMLVLGSSGYHRDEDAIRFSSDRFVRFLRALAQRPKIKEIILLSHSMGGRLGIAGLVALAGNPGKLRLAIFAAPDESAPHFEDALREYRGSAKLATLYASAKDYPLAFSRHLHLIPRAGEGGRDLIVMDGLESIDASAVDRDSIDNHWYVIDSPEVFEDLTKLVRQGLSARSRKLRQSEKNRLPFWIIDRGSSLRR